MREVLRLLAVGLVIGLPAVTALGRLVSTQACGVEASDPGCLRRDRRRGSTPTLALRAESSGRQLDLFRGRRGDVGEGGENQH